MKRLLYLNIAFFVGLGLAGCGDKKEGLLIPVAGALQSSAVPAVPTADLVPVNNGSSGTGSVDGITGDSATPGGDTPSGGSGDSGSSGSSGDSGSSGGSGDSGSSGGSGDSGSSGGSGDSGSSGGSGDSGSSGGSGDSGSSGGSGDSGSSGGSGDSGSSGGSGDSGSSGGSSGGGDTTPAKNTEASFTGKDYSHVDGKWYLDGITLFTYDKNNSVGFALKNMEAGTYTITISGKHWVKAGNEQALPAGFTGFQLMAGAGGGTTEANLPASSTEYKSVTFTITIPDGDSTLLLSWLNQTCGAESTGSDASSSDKVAVCHVPPGNPDNKHTIVVGANAVKAHLKHGDSEGACNVCANFGVETIKLQKSGSGLTAYIAGTLNKRNTIIALMLALVAMVGIVGIRLIGSRKNA